MRALAALVALSGVALFVADRVSTHTSLATINANRDRKNIAEVRGVADQAAKTLNMTANGIRWTIFAFDPREMKDHGRDKAGFVPRLQGFATTDWQKDFLAFKNALPANEVAAAVYNFEYWVSDDDYENLPILITFSPPGVSEREQARAGYYLGALMVATEGVQGHYALDSLSATYFDFCNSTVGIEESYCALAKSFHNCPFKDKPKNSGLEDEDETTSREFAARNPCKQEICSGAAFYQMNEDWTHKNRIGKECCDYILKDYCPAAEGAEGCHPFTLSQLKVECAKPAPGEVPVLLIIPEEAVCHADCVQPCALFDDPAETYKLCAACPTGGMVQDDGLVYQCHPEALGFLVERCCGIAPECELDASQVDEECGVLNAIYGCVWAEHMDCPDIKVEQTQVASGVGCCQITPLPGHGHLTRKDGMTVRDTDETPAAEAEAARRLNEYIAGEDMDEAIAAYVGEHIYARSTFGSDCGGETTSDAYAVEDYGWQFYVDESCKDVEIRIDAEELAGAEETLDALIGDEPPADAQ